MSDQQERTAHTIAIIGAGISGLAAAHTLQDAGARVTVYERQRRAGGRAATRRLNGYTYDYGAQYVKEGPPEIMAAITQRFQTPDLVDITQPIWTFDSQNRIAIGDPKQNAERKISYCNGLSSLVKEMARGIHIVFETTIAHIEQEDHVWNIYDSNGYTHGGFDAVLICIPAPQGRDLINSSSFSNTQLQTKIVAYLGSVIYNPLLSVTLGYRSRLRSRPYYALVNTDKQHDISWLAWEHKKCAERTPPGGGLLIAQMAPQYSQEHSNIPDTAIEAMYADVAQKISTLVEEDLSAPVLKDFYTWRFALPATLTNAQELNAITLPYRLAFCGDSFVGGRLHLAFEHGTIVARQIIGA